MQVNKKQATELSRQHAIAVLKDKGKIIAESCGTRIPTATLAAMLGLTYENGDAVTKRSADKALLHWHSTGFLVYTGNPDHKSSKQKAAADERLIKSAVAETMQNRKQWKKFTRIGGAS